VPVEERAPHGRVAGRRAATALLDRDERPTALLAMSDELAIGALQAAADRGLAVPDDVSVIGFDDTPAAADAQLTTIFQPHRAKGETAARMLLEPDAQPERVVLPTRLVRRASTA
jgi:DNA-binding LacI/PurR family transcriptional regulator